MRPGSITGSIDDGWQTAIEDVGPAGVDKGDGGAYLILPPDYEDPAPDGYIAPRSPTFRLFAILRSNLRSGSAADVAAAVDYGSQVKLYPLSEAAVSPATKFVDAAEVILDSTIQYDVRFSESLDRFVQREPWLTRDKAMIDTLKAIGIEKGTTFSPDEPTREILDQAAREARVARRSLRDAVRAAFHRGSPLGATGPAGARRGPLDGLRGPELVPGRCARCPRWSATAYDRTTHALIRNMSWASRSSHTPGLEHNPDGSVDLHFAPQPPDGTGRTGFPPNRAVPSR